MALRATQCLCCNLLELRRLPNSNTLEQQSVPFLAAETCGTLQTSNFFERKKGGPVLSRGLTFQLISACSNARLPESLSARGCTPERARGSDRESYVGRHGTFGRGKFVCCGSTVPHHFLLPPLPSRSVRSSVSVASPTCDRKEARSTTQPHAWQMGKAGLVWKRHGLR
ncbi:hypothetical protein GQ53DRAFT_751813 [Thozetella sp. PMI_491]|nr:hypothetical protein GQ53DRAFT_751813 [Thozetella sp. PMI_491]